MAGRHMSSASSEFSGMSVVLPEPASTPPDGRRSSGDPSVPGRGMSSRRHSGESDKHGRSSRRDSKESDHDQGRDSRIPVTALSSKRVSVSERASVKGRLSVANGGRKSLTLAGGDANKKIALEFGAERKTLRQRLNEVITAKAKILCNSWRFTVVTSVLTCYALFGDDFRLVATPVSADNLFNVVTVLCILIFAVEVWAFSLGQDEYFLGFFFWLDFGSTVTLLFDLTWVGNLIFCGGSGAEALKSNRAGRAGARAARTVRIIRLMRLVKLYKAYRAVMEERAKEGQQAKTSDRDSMTYPGDDQDDLLRQSDRNDLEDDELRTGVSRMSSAAGSSADAAETFGRAAPKPGAAPPQAETRVGKKLSDKTTRRVIILVLAMLFMLPQFMLSGHAEEFRWSANIASEIIYERFRDWCWEYNSSAVQWCLDVLETPPGHLKQSRELTRQQYENALLNFLYVHHEGGFAAQLFWLGARSQALERGPTAQGMSADAQLGQLAQLNTERWLGTATALEDWDMTFANPSWQLAVNPLPHLAKVRLSEPWVEKCMSYLGVTVATDVDVPPGSCSFEEELRCQERDYYVPLCKTSSEEDKFTLMFVFDNRSTTQLEAGLSLIQTVFICFCVAVGAMTFSKDANELLLNPIERMIAKMETIKDNPLEAMRLGDLEYRREEIEQAKRTDQLAKMGKCWKLIFKYRYMRKVKEPMETVMLEKTIIKLGALLALGFGEAGAEIIGQNMKGGATAGVNAMVPGEKVDTIVGFCNIRDFMDATEVLKEKVMLFVNQVGEIVHGCVDDYHGAPNKNIGDSFLLVWRISGAAAEKQTKMADMAIMSFVKIVAEINKSRVLAAYRTHPGLLQRINSFRVQMGFGLHCGWVIEGAIGSEFKIDASYLSPNVNVASRLEAATKQFGVWMLFSHFIISLCSQEMALVCRLVDHMAVKGSRKPVRLYTVDLDISKLEVVTRGPERIIKNRFKMRQLREIRKNEKWSDDFTVWESFRNDPDIQIMRARFTNEFFQRFAMAYRNYEAGEWMAARDMLFTCHYQPKSNMGSYMVTCEDAWPNDGPTVTLLRFMQQYRYRPPDDWPGFRELPDR